MSDWKVHYGDHLDQDRTFGVPSKDAALKEVIDLYYQKRAELYRVEGPEGQVLAKEEIMRWVSSNKTVAPSLYV